MTILMGLAVAPAANAFSCLMPLEFILKCQKNLCNEGFFAFYEMNRSTCTSTLNVKNDETIYQFDLSGSSLQPQPDGFYSIATKSIPLINDDGTVGFERCYKLNADQKLTLVCPPAKITKLNFSETFTLQDVMDDYVTKSKLDYFCRFMYDYSLAVFLLLLLIGRKTAVGQKHRRKLLALTILVSVVGLIQLLIFGPSAWALAGLLTIFVLICLKVRIFFAKS